uniref:Uncharacterized protein n=1 Tax=Arundo donax TaxID=35708 RepID=A0A0A9AP30_ARUDO
MLIFVPSLFIYPFYSCISKLGWFCHVSFFSFGSYSHEFECIIKHGPA